MANLEGGIISCDPAVGPINLSGVWKLGQVTQKIYEGQWVFPVVLEDGLISAADTINFATTPSSGTLILFFGQRGNNDLVLPSGYTLIAERTGTNARFLCAYKVAVGDETSVTSTSADTVGYAFLTPSTRFDVVGAVATANSNSITINGITPTKRALVFLVACANNSATSVSQDGTDWIEVFNSVTELSTSHEIVVWSKKISAGSTENVTVTFNNNPTVGVQFSVVI